MTLFKRFIRWERSHEGMRAAALILAMLMMASGITAFGVRNLMPEIEGLRIAMSDNIPWNLAQLETEFLRFQNSGDQAVLQAGGPDGPPGPDAVLSREVSDQVRLRFDILWSRVDTLNTSSFYNDVREDPEFAAAMAEITAFTRRAARVLNTDEIPVSGLIGALGDANRTHPEVRAVALVGISEFASIAEERRLKMAEVLREIALATFASFVLVLGLLGLVVHYAGKLQRTAGDRQKFALDMMAIVASSPIPVVIADRDGDIVEFNRAAELCFGYERDEIIGASVNRLMGIGGRGSAVAEGLEMFRTAPRTGFEVGEGERVDITSFPLELYRKDDSRFPAEVLLTEPRGETGKYIAFVRDISDWELHAEELRNARDKAKEGEAAKERLISTMSHEMRTPLHGMLAAIELLEGTAIGAEERRYANTIKMSAELLVRQIDDVLNAARLDFDGVTVHKREVELTALMGEILADNKVLVESSGNRIAVTGSTAPMRANCDPVRIKQVFYNLIGNANKFTPGGLIEFGFEPSTGDCVRFWVRDDGIGIPLEDQPRIFEDFFTASSVYTREYGGTGLGLGIVRRIINAMGGTIAVDSEPGEGSVFRFSIYCGFDSAAAGRAPEPERLAPPEPVAEGAGRPARVLFAEDNKLNREILTTALEAAGHVVVGAEDGLTAVAAAEAEAFDIVLMDISMPVMDGVEAARRIRASEGPNASVRLVALTAHAYPEDHAKFVAAGFDTVLAKPIGPSELVGLIARFTADGAPAEQAVRDEVAQAPLVDPAFLVDIYETLGERRVLLAVDEFHLDANKRLAEMLDRAGGPAPDRDGIRRDAHRLKGAAGLMGANRLAAALAALETGALELAPAVLAARIREVTATSDQTMVALGEELKRLAAVPAQ